MSDDHFNFINHEKVEDISSDLFFYSLNHIKQLHVSNTLFKKSNKSIHIQLNEIIIDKINCGQNDSLLLTQDGDVYVMEYNNSKQLGTGDIEIQFNLKNIIHLEKCIDTQYILMILFQLHFQ